MSKSTKSANFLDQLHEMIIKEGQKKTATASTGTAASHPVVDAAVASVSKATEHTDKNSVGPEKNEPQKFEQKPNTEPANPTKKHKTAEEEAEELAKEAKAKVVATSPDTTKPEAAKEEAPVKVVQKENVMPKVAEVKPEANVKLAALGQQLLDAINQMSKEGTASDGKATSHPGGDTKVESVSKKTEKTDKNKVGPEHNEPQKFEQKPNTEESNPTKAHKKAGSDAADEELDKEASYELGRQFARTFLASKTAADTTIYKEAGRRDFETLIATAAAELEQEEVKKGKNVKVAEAQDETEQIKLAEEAGAQAFYQLMKQAQEEEQSNQVKLAFEAQINKLISEKNAAEQEAAKAKAELSKQAAEMEKKAEEDKLDAKFASWGGRIVEEFVSRLKQAAS